MKIIRYAAAAATILAASITVAAADQLADIKAAGKIVCGVYGSEEPYSYEDLKTRELVGYEVDICRKFAEFLKVKAELKVVAPPARIPELVQSRVDVLIAALSYTPERGTQVDYSGAYSNDFHKCFVAQDSPIKTLDELEGKRISVVKGSPLTGILQKRFPNANVLAVEDQATSFLSLQQARVDAVCQRESLGRLMELRAQAAGTIKPVRFLPGALLNQKTGIALRKGQPELQKTATEYLVALEKSGDAAKIYHKWLGQDSVLKLPRDFVAGGPVID